MSATTAVKDWPFDLRRWQHAAVFLVACSVIISRRPDAVFHPQFFAEDGFVWFADANNVGWFHALFRTSNGELSMLARLGAALALLVPLSLAPLVLSLIAIAFQALPASLLLSPRSAPWGGLRFRTALAATYLVLPNTTELRVGITDSMWSAALCALLVLVAEAPTSKTGRVFMLSLLALSGLSGPFGILLMPIALFLLWRHRGRWHVATSAMLGLSSIIQAWGILVPGRGQRHYELLGASLNELIRILAGDIYIATLVGGNIMERADGRAFFVFLLCVALLGTTILAFAALKGGTEMRIVIVFSAMVLIVSLAFPHGVEGNSATAWHQIAVVPGIRYWLFPTIAFAWSLVWLVQRPEKPLKLLAGTLLALMCIGIVRDWRRPPMPDLHFKEYANRFEEAPAGTIVTIPGYPDGWDFRLVRR